MPQGSGAAYTHSCKILLMLQFPNYLPSYLPARKNLHLRGSNRGPYHRHMVFLAQSSANVPVPLSTQWAPGLLLTILWIFVVAALAGILHRFFRLDDRPRGSGA